MKNNLKDRYYNKNGPKHPDGTPRRPMSPSADGPRPEVSYQPDESGVYRPVESLNENGMPSSRPVISGAPRPDISWWKNGKLWKIFELKFGDDRPTAMQSDGTYETVVKHQGLDPQTDLVWLDVDDDCECADSSGKASPVDVQKCKD